MHSFSDLFDKVLYIFWTGPLSVIRSISTLYTRNKYLSCQFCWPLLAWSRLRTAHNQQNQYDKYQLRVYSVGILLMINSRSVRNMQSALSNEYEKQYIRWLLLQEYITMHGPLNVKCANYVKYNFRVSHYPSVLTCRQCFDIHCKLILTL